MPANDDWLYKDCHELCNDLDEHIKIISDIVANIRYLKYFTVTIERDTLILALKQAIAYYRYAIDYAELLQAHMSEEDYNNAMAEYHTDFLAKYDSQHNALREDVSDDRIAVEAKILLSVLDSELSTDEIAALLNLDVFQTEKALQQFKAKTKDTVADNTNFIDKEG